MANVNGNWKKRKPIQRNLSLKKIPGQGVRTHDVMKGISFKDKAYKWGASTRASAQKGWAFTKAGAQKGAGKIARSYRRYGKPTETLFRRVGSTALGAMAATPIPTLAATGLGLGAKALGKKWGRGYHYSAVRQFDKKGRKII